ncbi:MAG: aspartyl protease family protein [Planctomycetes bacterium]|nr:aspartyl protease family protein [Planctomycetota bacterium]
MANMNRNSASRWWAVAVLAAASCKMPAPDPNDPSTAPPPEMRVELRIAAGLPLVEGRLPGDVRAWFLIDTGAGNFTLFDQQLSSGLGLKHELVRDPLMPSIHFKAQVPFLEVDGMGRRDFTAYVADGLSDRPEFAGLGVPVSGVLGTGWFRGKCLWFDWKKGEFTAERARRRLSRHITLPLRFGVAGGLHCTVRLNGIACEALLDTGSAETLVPRELADRLELRYDAEKLAPHRPTAVGEGAVRDGSLERLALGTAELTALPVLIVERRIPNADLVIGTDVLSRFGVILDLADPAYLVLDPEEGAAPPEAHAPLPAGPGGAP